LAQRNSIGMVGMKWGSLPLVSARLTPPVQFPETPFSAQWHIFRGARRSTSAL